MDKSSDKLLILKSKTLNFNPQNILVIHFGQLGDVILGLPALSAIRKRFPDAHITALVGKPNVQIIELADFFDEIIGVDRVELRDSGKLWSIAQIFKIVRNIRRKNFDFVIDLHSLYETNLLGFLSGAKHRLFANRESRSLDYLANFAPKPPLEDKTKNATDFYLDVLKPLDIENAPRFLHILPRKSDDEFIENIWQKHNLKEKLVVGMFLGAGHPGRRWSIENFAKLTKLLKDENRKMVVFLGPEERHLREEVEEKLSSDAFIFDNLTLPQLAAALARVNILVSNDTGPMHLGAVMGAFIVMLSKHGTPDAHIPLTEKLAIVRGATLKEISVDEVFQTTRNILEEI